VTPDLSNSSRLRAIDVRRSSTAQEAFFLARQILLLGLPIFVAFSAVPAAAQSLAPARTAAQNPVAEQGVRWRDLPPAQQKILRPLERDWATTDPARKQKWLDIAARFPNLPASEQARIQARMADWARLTPEQRGQARQNFQAAKQVPALDRQAQWEAYQSLSPEERRKLAAKAAPTGQGASSRGNDPTRRADRPSGSTSQAKSNIVPNPAHAAPARRVAPTTVQAQPGATTTVISKRAAPPPHQQTGMPKIAASPNFVDKATLLPQRGPQGAASRSAAASAAEARR